MCEMLSRTGLSPTTATHPRSLPLTPHTPPAGRQTHNDNAPQHPIRNPCRVSHEQGLASSAFARHYSRNHNCFLFQWVLRCFTSPRSPQHPMHSDVGDTSSHVPGYPIRTPSDHSSVDNSPRTIAASHVLHRPLMPRHPPCALNNFTTTPHTHNHTNPKISPATRAGHRHEQKFGHSKSRCSHPLSNTQHTTTPPPTHNTTTPTDPPADQQGCVRCPKQGAATREPTHHRCLLRTQQCADTHPPPRGDGNA